jgi:hypothetical protein
VQKFKNHKQCQKDIKKAEKERLKQQKVIQQQMKKGQLELQKM